MKQGERLSVIYDQFDRSAKAFCEGTDGLFCDILSEYKGVKKPENLKYRLAKIYYHAFVVEFKYTAHGMLSVTNSLVDCRVYFDKTENAVGIPMALLVDYCDVDTATPVCIPCISNEPGMQQAIDCVGGVVKQLLPEIARISSSTEQRNEILNTYRAEVKYIFDLSDSELAAMDINSLCSDFFTLRFVSESFLNYIKGDRARAVKQLSKIKKLTGYEKRMIRLWSISGQNDLPDLSAIVDNAQCYNASGVQKGTFKEFMSSFIAWFVLTPAISAVYLGLFFFLTWLEGRNSVYLMGPIYNFPYCILLGFLTAIGASYFTRFRFYKWLFKKDYDKYCEMEHIQNGGGSDRLMKGFLAVLVAGSLAGCVLFAKWNLNFLADGFYDNTDFFCVKGTFHSYDEVERVYYKPDRVNDFGEMLNYPSYVLVLKNGEEIDLYEFDDIEEYETDLLEYLRTQGVKIE